MVLSLMVLPRVPAGMLLSLHLMHMALHYSRLPEIWNSEFWDGLIELTVLLVAAVGLLLWPQLSPLSVSDWWMINSAAPARACFVTLYSLTVLFKLTASFLDPAVSCAPLFPMALLESVYPQILPEPPTALLRFVVSLSPAASVLIEALVPLGLVYFPWRLGLGIGVCFHWLIAMTPPPNNAGGFSCGVLARYFFLKPEACTRAFRERPSSLFSAISVATVGYTVVLGARRNGDWGVVIAHVLSLFYLHAMMLPGEAPPPPQPRVSEGRRMRRALSLVRYASVGATLAYGMGPILGVQDMGATSMFANLHVYGGSNHLLGMPTGLLFREEEAAEDNDESSSFGPSSRAAVPNDALVGGVVRIDFTDAKHFNDIHPHEMTSLHAPRLRKWLVVGGHSGRQFGAYVARVMHLKAPPAVHEHLSARDRFVPYLIPLVELRRLILEATAPTAPAAAASGGGGGGGGGRRTIQPFMVDYAKIDTRRGKELGRFTVRFDKHGRGRCVRGGGACRRDLARLTTPLPAWANRVLLFFSFPVAKGQVSFRELSCTC